MVSFKTLSWTYWDSPWFCKKCLCKLLAGLNYNQQILKGKICWKLKKKKKHTHTKSPIFCSYRIYVPASLRAVSWGYFELPERPPFSTFSPWTVRRLNQSILKEINPEYSLEGLMLKLQYSGHLMQKADSLDKTLMLRKTEGRRRGRHRMRWGWCHWLNGHDMSKFQELVMDREAWQAAVHRVTDLDMTERLNWTELAWSPKLME